MLIDCDSCEVRGASCRDCVVSFLTIPVGAPERPVGTPVVAHEGFVAQGSTVVLDDDQHRAVVALASAGLVPPLRLVRDWGAATVPGVRDGRRAAAS